MQIKTKYLIIGFMVCAGSGFIQPAMAENRKVVLLHGLARSSSSMNKLENALQNKGFITCNIDYPSTKHSVEILAQEHILPKIIDCLGSLGMPICFVTHSMGGIVVRYLAEHALIPHIDRVVMLSPPNKGSQIVDRLGKTWLFKLVNGPAGQQLGTNSESLPLKLKPANFEVGIITGSRSINLIFSLMIKGKDDGKVSIENAKLKGMKDFMVLPSSHPFIMKNNTAIEQTIFFLNYGVFQKKGM
ncbi:esterase/lipase family protein [Desulfobacula toluolica]|uniref:Alpha/beta hydrolase n=1 Tax=Desulfobacula toluolica (strain DSM 7467 / Tol2) TaxID=651182 RepID=K0NCR0_DESTT|nr:acetyltransferase [Desulfobacula toluolica]CCK78470.1 uncharacterized protein TOL2_C03000 [Desulfobacula toluolica Tol2]